MPVSFLHTHVTLDFQRGRYNQKSTNKKLTNVLHGSEESNLNLKPRNIELTRIVYLQGEAPKHSHSINDWQKYSDESNVRLFELVTPAPAINQQVEKYLFFRLIKVTCKVRQDGLSTMCVSQRSLNLPWTSLWDIKSNLFNTPWGSHASLA